MNKRELMNELAAVTGESAETCGIVLKGFEKVSEEALASKFCRKSYTIDEKLELISEFTQVDIETCRIIVTELDRTLGMALSNRLSFFRRHRAAE